MHQPPITLQLLLISKLSQLVDISLRNCRMVPFNINTHIVEDQITLNYSPLIAKTTREKEEKAITALPKYLCDDLPALIATPVSLAIRSSQ